MLGKLCDVQGSLYDVESQHMMTAVLLPRGGISAADFATVCSITVARMQLNAVTYVVF